MSERDGRQMTMRAWARLLPRRHLNDTDHI